MNRHNANSNKKCIGYAALHTRWKTFGKVSVFCFKIIISKYKYVCHITYLALYSLPLRLYWRVPMPLVALGLVSYPHQSTSSALQMSPNFLMQARPRSFTLVRVSTWRSLASQNHTLSSSLPIWSVYWLIPLSILPWVVVVSTKKSSPSSSTF